MTFLSFTYSLHETEKRLCDNVRKKLSIMQQNPQGAFCLYESSTSTNEYFKSENSLMLVDIADLPITSHNSCRRKIVSVKTIFNLQNVSKVLSY